MKADRFVLTARGPNGQLKTIRFTLQPDDQRWPAVVGCELLAAQTGVDGWSPLTVEWSNQPEEQA